jgi:protein transport protein SEC31
VFQIFDAEINRVKAKAPAQFRPQVLDTEKRLGILFDHLNNGDLVGEDVLEQLGRLAEALRGRAFEEAQGVFQEVMVLKGGEGEAWMVWLVSLMFFFSLLR